jgi:hypothetical protein
MKTLILSILLFAAAVSSASVNPIDLIIQADPTSHTLTLRTTTHVEADTKVQIVDAYGLTLHTTRLDSGEYLNKRFKLAALPVGTYDVVVRDEQGETRQPLLIGPNGIEADPALATRSFYPQVRLDQKLLTINYLNTAGSRVNVRLTDAAGNNIISDRLPGEPSLHRAYSLEQLPAGDYYVTVSGGNQLTHTTSVRIR